MREVRKGAWTRGQQNRPPQRRDDVGFRVTDTVPDDERGNRTGRALLDSGVPGRREISSG
ncbi:hypothetical protein AW168_37505 [Nocardia brasiliensis]|nr:hypothetical protein AW168_37505 [Nocardia brasiliensis]